MIKLTKEFFLRKPDVVARELLGKVLIAGSGKNAKKARIVETEAYFGVRDPASRASKGDNKVSRMMLEDAGRILVYNVHMHKMLNFVCLEEGKAGAVLVRACEPINFDARCCGPGLLTSALGICDEYHGKEIGNKICVFDDGFEVLGEKVGKSFRIGVTEDLKEPFRFFLKGNEYVSR